MKFYLVHCKDHGWNIFDEQLRKDEKANLQCFGGHRFSTDTRLLELYEAEISDLPNPQRLTDDEKTTLISSGKIKPVLFWFGVAVTFRCPECQQMSAEKLALASPFKMQR